MTTVIHPIVSTFGNDSVRNNNVDLGNGCVLSLQNPYIDIAKGKWYDPTLSKNTGSIIGGVRNTNHKGLYFDGIDDYVNCGNTTSLNPDYIAISAWIKNSGSVNIEQIVGKDEGVTYRVWQFRKSDANTIQFVPFNAASVAVETGATNIADGVWHHVIGTWDGATIQVYVDGEQDGSGTVFAGTLRQAQSNNVLIGRDDTSTGPNWFVGDIDDVRIYNKALSENVAATLYNQTKENYL